MRFSEYSLKDLKGRTRLSFYHAKAPSGVREFREHSHTECEIALFISGEGKYSVLGKSYPFRKGDIFLFAGNEIHYITEISDAEPLDVIGIQFEPKLIWESGYENTPLLKLFTDRSESFQNLIDRKNPKTEEIRRQILEMEDEFSGEKEGFEIKIKMLLFSILLTLLRDFGYIRENAESISRDTLKRLSSATDYINKNLSENLTLSDISRTAGLAPTYFSAIFKKYNGVSPFEYITVKRVEKAISLLKNGSSSVLSAAEDAGFTSSSNFYKAFFKVTGKKPKDYI